MHVQTGALSTFSTFFMVYGDWAFLEADSTILDIQNIVQFFLNNNSFFH